MKVYLAGFIQGSKLKECILWRKQIREYYKDYPFVFLDPLNGKDFASISQDGLKSSRNPHSIIHRDYKSVTSADLIIANMNTFEEQRPLTGTICELAWAWEKHIPIIMITKEDKYKLHPFLSYFASDIVSSVNELFESGVVYYFYSGLVNALY